ncbi:pectate lyase superfamily protein-domain-containing protein [Xylariales sp. AK1849]|nr:pectate lyase superfamily protein-domain-containing protein [Xylariales sp. AK1849]
MHFQSFVSLSCFASATLAHYVPRNDQVAVSSVTTSSRAKCGSKPTSTSSLGDGGSASATGSSSDSYTVSHSSGSLSSNSATVSGTASASSVSSSYSTTSSSTSSSASSTASACSYWLEDIESQGIAPFQSGSASYAVFRNVKDYGAKGDGQTDDTAAINRAISDGNRCAPGSCASSTTTPALVYFPSGTYVVSGAIIDYYYTQIIGNPNCMPIIKAASSFSDAWIIDGDKYGSNGLGFGATNVFWRQIRNFIIDMTDIPATSEVYGIHWPTAQATSLQNIVFQMSSASGTKHEGLFIEEGSGGFVNDLVFYGGLYGLNAGNQQFTMRNLTFYNSVTAIRQIWDWGWTYSGISINNCQTGLDLTAVRSDGSQDVGSVVLIDSEINDTPVGISTARDANSSPPSGGSLVLENVVIKGVDVAIQGPGGTLLEGSAGSSVIAAWGQGHAYYGTSGQSTFQGPFTGNSRPASLTSGTDYYARSKPQYDHLSTSEFVSIRDVGAAGDGVTDDSDAINVALLAAATSGRVVFFDAGYYKVTKTIFVPANCKIVGEAFPVILSSGAFFADINNPKPVVQVGLSGQSGTVEWSDMIVSTQGAQAGAILIQWNLASLGSPSGMWDVHTRIGGFTGSNLQVSQCPKTPDTTITSANLNAQCIAAYLSVHVTESAAGLYMENCWLWVADHDADDASLTQITVYAGRGLLIESSAGGIWLVGTAVEHHVLYEYQLVNTRDVFMGQIQTETAYYQPNPGASIPFPTVTSLNDPVLASSQDGWGLRVVDSTDVFVYGAGLYSFFNNYDGSCNAEGGTTKCQSSIFSVEGSDVSVYNLNTIGTTWMAQVDGTTIANWADNANHFVSTVAVLRSVN